MSAQKDLHKAIKSASVEGVKKALDAGANPCFKDPGVDGSTPLGLIVDIKSLAPAFLAERVTILQLLLKKEVLFQTIVKKTISDAKVRAEIDLREAEDAEDKHDQATALESMISILNQALKDIENDESRTFFQELLFSEKFSDVKFTCNGGGTVYAHKVVLAKKCPYFGVPLSARWAEDKPSMIEFKPDSSLPVMEAVLSFIYMGNANLAEEYMVQHKMTTDEILKAGDEYQLPGLVSFLQDDMKSRLSLSTLKGTLLLAHQHNLADLKTVCFDCWRKRWKEIMFGEHSSSLLSIAKEDSELWKEIEEAVCKPNKD